MFILPSNWPERDPETQYFASIWALHYTIRVVIRVGIVRRLRDYVHESGRVGSPCQ